MKAGDVLSLPNALEQASIQGLREANPDHKYVLW